jgi:type I restriction enzyme R subunit
MNEAETRAELIDPALEAAGWGVVEASRVRREQITKGRIEGSGRRGEAHVADYVLVYRGKKLAVIEAKRRDLPVGEGVGQAKRDAAKLQARFAFATNGDAIWRIDMTTGAEGPALSWPTPDELWQGAFAEANAWRDRFAAVPFEDRGGQWEPRYYQHIAIERVLEAIADGRDRMLLTLATGTGKTAIAFQIAWRLFHSRWNLADWKSGDEPRRRPRILFLADRNNLADQAFNEFSAFPEDAMVRIDPGIIRQKGRVPKNGNVFFTIFQTFMTGRDAAGLPAPSFGDYPPDFFDFIVIDECHRGGANDESNWRGILEYFAPAVQLGLTATPRRDVNADTYRYFGEPVFVYSLREGIEDGFLTPFKVKQIATTLDDYVYTSDDTVIEGELEEGRRYDETDFNRIIEIKAREAYRVRLFMELIDQREKTLVFCATQDHALAVRDLVNQMKTSREPDYCVRVTANDGAEGDRQLRVFRDNEKTIPTILTTSQKLSTGVDARNVRNIVLMRPIKSMIEFKQIIGRGTRLFDGKDHFTIWDFVRAYEHFSDPEWDGEPMEPPDPAVPRPRPDPDPGDRDPPDDDEDDDSDGKKRQRLVIRLADGKERAIRHMVATSFWGPDGKPISAAEFLQRLFGELPAFFADEDELRRLWSVPDTRKALLDRLAEHGYGREQLAEVQSLIEAEASDLYDVLAHVAFARGPITREARAAASRDHLAADYDDRLRAFLDFVLGHYVDQGVAELDPAKLPDLLTLRYGGINDARAELGDMARIRQGFIGFQRHLYEA